MKILFFMDVFIFGGCEKMLKEVTDELIKEHDVELLLIYRSKDNTYLKMLDPKVKVDYLWDIDSKSNFIKRCVYWVNLFFPSAVIRKHNFKKYDCVINFKDDYQINILAKKIKRPVIAWVHNITQNYSRISKKGIKYRLADVVYNCIYKKYINTFSKFHSVIFVSEHAKSALEEINNNIKHPFVIYNYLNYQEIIDMSSKKFDDSVLGQFTFCYVGRLSAEKGVVELVDAFCRLNNKNNNTRLIVIGEGYQLSELQMIVEKNECSNCVNFLGTLDNPYPYIKNSDVIICASYKESFGLVVLESLVLGKCIVSTRCGGPEELILNGKNGYLVNDYNELYDVLNKLNSKELPLLQNQSLPEHLMDLKKEFYNKLNVIFNNITR